MQLPAHRAGTHARDAPDLHLAHPLDFPQQSARPLPVGQLRQRPLEGLEELRLGQVDVRVTSRAGRFRLEDAVGLARALRARSMALCAVMPNNQVRRLDWPR